MKKLLVFVIAILLCFNALAQLDIKPGSFREVPGFMNTNQDPNFQTDDNDFPFAIVKVITENLDNQQRRQLLFQGNAATYIMLEYKPGEIWVYLTAKYADYLKISHPDYSTVEFQFPITLKENQGYEMTLTLRETPQDDAFGSLVVRTKPENDAEVLINGTKMNMKTPYTNELIPAGTYEITVSKVGLVSVTKTVEIKADERTTVDIEMIVDIAKITLKADYDTDVYVDGKLKTKGTWCGDLNGGNHEIVYKKQNYNDAKQTIIVEAQVAKTYELKLTPIYGKMTVDSNPTGASVIIDGKSYGTTPLTLDNVIIGTHVLRLENANSYKIQTFVLDASNIVTINEKLESGRKISISTNEKGDMIYVDGKYFGESPLSAVLGVGEHEIAAVRGAFREIGVDLNNFRDSKEVDITTKNITVSATGGNTAVKLNIELLSKKTYTVNGVSFDMIGVKGGKLYTRKLNDTVKDFYIGKLEVTQKLWKAVMGSNPSKNWIGDNLPVENINLDDCLAFIKKLNQLTGLNFRLPTEAEWEFAARGGVKTHGFIYSGSNNLDDVAWYDGNTDISVEGVRPVGKKQPNELGIYDMSGNVGEFFWNTSMETRKPNSWGQICVGGAYHDYANSCNVSSRSEGNFDWRQNWNGLRLAIDK